MVCNICSVTRVTLSPLVYKRVDLFVVRSFIRSLLLLVLLLGLFAALRARGLELGLHALSATITLGVHLRLMRLVQLV